MKLFTVNNATYKYQTSNNKAIDDVSLSMESGEYIALLGANGSGKSTLARMIAGFFDPDSGSVEMDKDILPGIVFQQPKEQIVAGVVERDTAFGPQNLNLSKSEIELRTIECLSVIGLADRSESRTFELSLGQTQRLAFSGILALFPDLLILDEVTAMLDPGARTELVQFVDQWNSRGHAIIHVTHDEDEALRAKRIIVMDHGKKIFDGPRAEFEVNTEIRNLVFGSNEELFNSPKRTPKEIEESPVTLEVNNLCFSYENREIFRDVSFKLHKGSLTALTGPSGCGKSTMFECLSGLLKTSGGEMKAVSRPVLALQESEASLFEKYAADDVSFGPRNLGVQGKELVKRVKSSMKMAGLDYKLFADRATFALSGGEKRKLSIAGIIALDSDIMIFDEPTSALDPESRRNMLKTLRSLADSGKTVLFSTHRMEEAEIADVRFKWEDLNKAVWGGNAAPAEVEECCGEKSTTAESNSTLINASFEKNAFEVAEKSETLPLKKFDAIPNASILQSLHKTGSAFMAPSQVPNSPIAKLPAVLKSLLFFVIFITSVTVYPLYLCGIMLIVNVLYAILAAYPLKKPLTAIRKLLPWILVFAVIEFIFFPATDGAVVLYSWKWFVITDNKLFLLGKAFLRGFTAIFSIGTFIYTTSEREILDGLSAILKPLALMKVPVRYFVLVVGIIFRFIPLLMDEMCGIMKTQIVRGAFANAKGFKKLGIIVPLFVPIMLQTFRKAQTLSDALTARYFR